MPASKNALFRCVIIDECLQNNRKNWTVNLLLEKVNRRLIEEGDETVSRNTIDNDLYIMEVIFSKEFERIQSNNGTIIKYAIKGDSLLKQSLNNVQIAFLQATLRELSKFKGLMQSEMLAEHIQSLKMTVGQLELEREIISHESKPNYKGNKFLIPIFNAISKRVALKMRYRNFKNSSPVEFEIHPYYLKQFNLRWFVLGRKPNYGDTIQVHALDRIMSIEELDIPVIDRGPTDWENYFKDIIGVTNNPKEPVVDVVILVRDKVSAGYIFTKPLHTSQRFERFKNGALVTITVKHNHELEKLLLSFGEQIAVLSPEHIRRALVKRIRQLNENYPQEAYYEFGDNSDGQSSQ